LRCVEQIAKEPVDFAPRTGEDHAQWRRDDLNVAKGAANFSNFFWVSERTLFTRVVAPVDWSLKRPVR